MKTISIESVICAECKLPTTVNSDGVCEFCRLRVPAADATAWLVPAVFIAGMAVIIVAGFWFAAGV